MLSIKRYIYYILSCLLIFSTDTFVVATNQNRIFFYFLPIIFIVSLFFLLLGCQNFLKSNLIILLILLTVISANMFFYNDISKGNVYKMLLLLYGMSICSFMDFSIFRDLYVKIMTIVCLFSLIVYLLSFVITFSDYFPIITNATGFEVVFVGLTNVPVDVTDKFIRNFGPFWEPGVYSIYLCLAVIFALKYNEMKMSLNVYLFIMGILTTFSTTGIILLLIIFIIYLFFCQQNGKDIYIYKMKILLALAVSVLLLLTNSNIYEMVFAKLSIGSEKFSSTLARMHSVYANVGIFLDYPLIGCGIDKYTNVLISNYDGKEGMGTNGLLIQFAMYGIIVGMIYLWNLFSFCGSITQIKNIRYMLFLVFILMLCAEPLQFSLLFNTIIFWKARKRNFFYSHQELKCNIR